MVVLLGGLKELCICLNICYRDYNGMLRLYNLIRNKDGAAYVFLKPTNVMKYLGRRIFMGRLGLSN